MTYNVFSGTLNPTQSINQPVYGTDHTVKSRHKTEGTEPTQGGKMMPVPVWCRTIDVPLQSTIFQFDVLSVDTS